MPLHVAVEFVPIDLLKLVSPGLTNPRAVALVSDVLWCLTGDRLFAEQARVAHTVCATDAAISESLLEMGLVRIGVPDEELERDRRRPRALLRVSHLGRAIELAQTFRQTDVVAELHTTGLVELSAAAQNGLEICSVLDRLVLPDISGEDGCVVLGGDGWGSVRSRPLADPHTRDRRSRSRPWPVRFVSEERPRGNSACLPSMTSSSRLPAASLEVRA